MIQEARRPELARRAALVTAAVAALIFVVLAVVLVPWNWVPGGTLEPLRAGDLFTPAEIARAEHYATLARFCGWSGYFVGLVAALVFGLTPLGARWQRNARDCEHDGHQ